MRLLEIRSDPVAFFMPTKAGPGGNLFFNAGPPGLAPELAELFMRPITNLNLSKRRGEDANGRPAKKARLEENGDVDEVEQARREASVARSIGVASDLMPPAGPMDFGIDIGGMDGFDMQDDFQFDASADIQPDNLDMSKAGGDQTRLSTPAGDFAEELETYADADCPIATFDVRPSQSQATGQTQTQEDMDDVNEEDQKKGYSKNTLKALGILRRELDPSPEAGEKVLSFAQMSEKVSNYFYRRLIYSFTFYLGFSSRCIRFLLRALSLGNT